MSRRVSSFAASLLIACGSGSTGTLTVKLTDAPLDSVEEVNVPVNHVKVRVRTDDSADDSGEEGGESGWHTLPSDPQVINLLELQDGVTQVIGEGELPAGEITELRLVLGNDLDSTIVLEDGTEEELQTPSGDSSGLKVKGSIPVEESDDLVVLIDFDAQASVHETGNGRWSLQPVLRVVESNVADSGE